MDHSAAASFPHPEERATKNSSNAKLDNVRDNPLGIWKFDDALRYWAPAMEEAEFCHRRRPGHVAGEIQRVILATSDGFYPSISPQEGNLILRDWNKKWCFWTIDDSGKRFVVKSVGDRSEDGVHWVRWLGVTERYGRQPVAWPIRTSAETSLAARRPNARRPSESSDEFFSVLGDPSDHEATIHDANPDQPERDIAFPKKKRRLFSRNALDRMAAEAVAERLRQLATEAISPFTPHQEDSAAHSFPPFTLQSRDATPGPAGNEPAPGASTQTTRSSDALHTNEEDEHAAGLEGERLAEYKRLKDEYCRILGNVLRGRRGAN
ncbi:MAG: hypothetical protein Q9212_007163 [Teloschistes hypoglaucus]